MKGIIKHLLAAAILLATAFQASAQSRVSGKVTDEGGSPLPGVAVMVEGTGTGTVTDEKGNYSISGLKAGATLVFSCLGMAEQSVVWDGMMQTQVPCPDCHGEGTIIKNKCKHCGGDGIVKGDEVVEINIPAGVEDGMCVSVRGKGNAGKHNGINGDIQVLIQEEKSDIFERNGQDLYYNLVLDFTTATLGGEVEVPTIDGKTTLKIEPGTQPGKQMRLRGKGLPAVQGYGYGKGDIIVNITVFVPKTLTKEEKALVLKFKECENFKADSATKKSLFESFKNLFK